MAKFTLTCKSKDGNAQTQLIPEEATLLCKSNSEAESKVSSPIKVIIEKSRGGIFLWNRN